jgi:hypothetical protein
VRALLIWRQESRLKNFPERGNPALLIVFIINIHGEKGLAGIATSLMRAFIG